MRSGAGAVAAGGAVLLVLGAFAWWSARSGAPLPAAPSVERVAPRESLAAEPPALPAPALSAAPEAPALPAPPETREALRAIALAALRGAIAERLPDHKLSSDEIERLADSVLAMREAREELAALPVTAETAARRAQLVASIGAAAADFEHVLEMAPAEFTALAEPETGVSRPAPDEPVPPPEYLDAYRDAQRVGEP